MLSWTKRGEALTSAITLRDGRKANAVIVGPSDNPKGASLIVVAESGEAVNMPVRSSLDLLTAQDMIDILCMQEQTFSAASAGSEAETA